MFWPAKDYCYNQGMSSLQEIFEAAQTLPAGERAWLIHALWGTVESKDWVPPGEEWIAEAQHRSASSTPVK